MQFKRLDELNIQPPKFLKPLRASVNIYIVLWLSGRSATLIQDEQGRNKGKFIRRGAEY